MKNKFKIKSYKTLYPLTLYVCTYEELEDVKKKFDAYNLMEDLRTQTNPKTIITDFFGHGFTGLVMDRTNGNLGVLVSLEDELADVATIAHESVHVADAIFDYCGICGQGFDESNEPYAYLVGWIVGKISEYLTEYKRNKEASEKRED